MEEKLKVLYRYSRLEISALAAMYLLDLRCVEDLYAETVAAGFDLPRVDRETAMRLASPILPILNVPKTGLREFVVGLAKRHGVKYVQTPLDELATAFTRLSGDDVDPDDVELLLIELKRSGVISGKDMGELLINYFRELQQSQEWFDKFETMSVDEVAALFAALSNYLLSDAFKRRCGIAPAENGGARTVNEILAALAGGEISLPEATGMLGVTDSGHTLRLLAEAGLEMPRLPSDTVSRQAAETHDALKACLLPPGEKVKGASKDE